MKKIKALLAVIFVLASTSLAYALPANLSFDFYYPTTPPSLNWGVMTLSAFDADTIQIVYAATSAPNIPAGTTATGFGFIFDTMPSSVSNDANAVLWYQMTSPTNFPNPANGPNPFNVTYGATNNPSGGNPDMSYPGITAGGSDTFFINFTNVADFTSLTSLAFADFVDTVAVRLQDTGNFYGGSLLLVGTPNGASPVPEPSTMLLVGAGLLAAAIWKKWSR